MIIIPMLGNSSRFFKAGYSVPKYELPLAGHTVFYWVLQSFRKYFNSEHFLFLVREDFDGEKFVRNELEMASIQSFEILSVRGTTEGQAATVALGIKETSHLTDSEPIYIFNADSFMPDFSLPMFESGCGGVLDVFEGEGEHWSFVEPGNNNQVLRTTEKERISNLCSNGFYAFSDANLFEEIYLEARKRKDAVNGEYYVAPLYNLLIEKGLLVNYRLVADSGCIFCGTPDEYEALINGEWSGFGH